MKNLDFLRRLEELVERPTAACVFKSVSRSFAK